MKALVLGFAFLLSGTIASQAVTSMPPMKSSAATMNVRMECNASRCLDTRTGAYTQSGCNYRGCYPIGGIVGYIGDEDGGPRRRGRSYSGGSWDCNRYRCIEPNTGRVWESTCNRSGCSPLRPARRNY